MRKLIAIALIVAASPAAALDVNGSGGERLGAGNVYTYNRNTGFYSDTNGNLGVYNEQSGQTMMWRRDGAISTGTYNDATGVGYSDGGEQ